MASLFVDDSDLEAAVFEDLSTDFSDSDITSEGEIIVEEDEDEPEVPLVPIRGRRPGRRVRRPHPTDNLQWVTYNESDVRCEPFNFSGTPGVRVNITDYNDPLEIFKLFFTQELVDLIVEQTNAYAQEFLSYRPLRQFSRYRAWKATDANEIYVLLALYTMIGLIWKPELEKYFTKKKLFSTPGFSTLISHNRLKLLNKFLHFTNAPMPRSGNKKLHKIMPIFSYLVAKFAEVYTPERDVSIDESLLLWKGRLGFKQFIRIKRARFGIKTYILSEARSGYIWKMIIYVGKETDLVESVDNGHATRVLLTLMKDLYNKGYCVYADNFYCSPEAALALAEQRTDLVGTIRSNRKGLPAVVMNQQLNRNETIAATEAQGKMMVLKWADKRNVHLLSTKHELHYKEVVRKGNPVLVPGVVDDYNIFMGGVDKVDQMLSAYPLERKRQKIWYKKEFKHLVNMTIFNSLALHHKEGGQMTNLEFREALVERLVEVHHNETRKVKRGRPSAESDPIRLIQRHFPEYVPATENKAGPTRRCVVCSKQNIRRESRYQCVECGVGLCAAPCFKNFHTKKNY